MNIDMWIQDNNLWKEKKRQKELERREALGLSGRILEDALFSDASVYKSAVK